MKELTAHQREVLGFIVEYQRRHGFPPSVREICGRFGFRSNRTVQGYLDALQKKGYIQLYSGKKRGIKILRPAGIPVVGRIPAGSPVIPYEEFEEVLNIDPAFFTTDPCFAVRVNGDSLSEIGIYDGDYVILRQQSVAESGQIVAAFIDEEITLKVYVKKADRVELQPRNPKYTPILFKDSQPVILGVYVGLIRKAR